MDSVDTDLQYHEGIERFCARKVWPTWIGTFEHGVLSIRTLTVVGNLCLLRRDTFAQWTTRGWLAWIWDVWHRVPSDDQSWLLLPLASVQSVPFHPGRHWQRKPFSKSVHVPLLAHGYERHSSNSNPIHASFCSCLARWNWAFTLITGWTGKAWVTLAGERVRCVWNTSAMLITDIRRAC